MYEIHNHIHKTRQEKKPKKNKYKFSNHELKHTRQPQPLQKTQNNIDNTNEDSS